MKQLGRNGRDVTVEKKRLERVLHCLACLPSQQLSRKVVLRTFSLPLLTQLTTIHRHNSPPSPTRLTSIDSLLFSLPHTHYSLPSPYYFFSLPRTHCSLPSPYYFSHCLAHTARPYTKGFPPPHPSLKTTSPTHTMGVSKKETINPRRGGSRGAQKSAARTSGAASDGPSASKKAKRSMKSGKNPWEGIPNCLAGKSVSFSPFSWPWSTTKHL